MPKIALPPIADWTLGTGLENYGSGIIRTTLWGRTVFSDDFSNSSLDANWTSITSGNGTVAETTSLTLTYNTAGEADAAAVYYETDLPLVGPWKIKIKLKMTTYSAGCTAGWELHSSGSVPAAASNGNSTYDNIAAAFSSATNLRFKMRNIAAAIWHWATTSLKWGSSAQGNTLSSNTYYWYVIENKDSIISCKVYSDDESTLIHASYANCKFHASTWTTANTNGYVVLGDLSTSSDQGIINAGLFTHYGAYVSTSPEAESPWIAIDSDLDATTPIDLVENPLGGTGSLKYQYATNSGAYNGSWVAEASMLTALQDLVITDKTNSLRIKAQFISDGDQSVELGIASYVKADAAAAAGGGGRPELRSGNL